MKQYLTRWQKYSDRCLYLEIRQDDWPYWSLIGMVSYYPLEWPRWLWWWLMPRRFYASVQDGRIRKFLTLSAAQEYVEENGMWP